jgi:alpha-L-arabinofuranosidase
LTRIAVDPARPVGRLDRKVFGGFVEHLGRCIYGGLYEEGSPLSDDRGFRKDVLGLLRELRLGVLRWPGGNFVSNYHWADGIGPKDGRPRRPELAWGGEESNRFGTDEYLAYCAELGTEPYICLNMGTGTLADALAWVEYCNSAGSTHWAQRRRENGRSEPWRVTYWGLGNEMYGDWQAGALTAGEYVREATRWARAIRMLDPRAKLVSCDWVQMANLAQMVNAIAPVVTSPEAAAVQPIWYPVLLHSQAALDLAVDVHVSGPAISPELPAGASRWPFRVGDLGPFGLIDAAATVGASVAGDGSVSANSVSAHKVAVTLVNRSPGEELAEVLLRDHTFAGSARIRTATAARPGDARTLPDVETARLEEGSEDPKDGMVAIRLPPRSFTVIEAAMTDR